MDCQSKRKSIPNTQLFTKGVEIDTLNSCKALIPKRFLLRPPSEDILGAGLPTQALPITRLAGKPILSSTP